MTHLREYALRFGIAFAASLVVTLAVRTAARRMGWVAKPRPDRWHRKPTALFGGIGIWGGFLVAYLSHRPAAMDGDAILALCATAMFALGVVDDRFQLKPYTKLVGQIICATLFTVFGARLSWVANPILDHGLTIFWLVGVTNALNLLDNIDGAAGGVAAIAGAYLVYFSHAAGRFESAQVAAAFAGAVIGFLVFNFNPASIFMGDCGSLFLGFFLGGSSLVNNQIGARKNVVAVLSIPVLLLLLPILDTTLVTITRRYHGRAVSQGGRDHTSHRLVAIGMSERRATLTLWSIAAAAGGLAVLVNTLPAALALALVGVFLFGLTFLMVFLGRVKVYERVQSESEARGRALLPTLADFSYKRRVFETMNDLALILLCYYGAFLLRFDGQQTDLMIAQFLKSVPVVVVAQLAVFLATGLYRGVWRYTGMDDLTKIVRSVGTAMVLSTVAVLFFFRFEGLSRAVMVIDGILLLIGVAGSRVSFRLLRTWLVRRRPSSGRRVLIYGAGDGGELLVRELQNNPALNMVAVGFVDDDPQKTGRMIHGVPVVGLGADVGKLLPTLHVEEVVFSTSKVESERWDLIARTCKEQGLGCRKLRIALE
jgi:UDP-GlcNAc:undecaprenyl-phosphate GlcNAc-1-phosphate transferase